MNCVLKGSFIKTDSYIDQCCVLSPKCNSMVLVCLIEKKYIGLDVDWK